MTCDAGSSGCLGVERPELMSQNPTALQACDRGAHIPPARPLAGGHNFAQKSHHISEVGAQDFALEGRENVPHWRGKEK